MKLYFGATSSFKLCKTPWKKVNILQKLEKDERLKKTNTANSDKSGV